MITSSSPVTLKDVARRAYVSVATASLSLRDKPGVSERTRSHVKSVAADLGYHASAAGVLLRNGRRPVMGVLLDDEALISPDGDSYRVTLAALVANLGARGCLLSVLSPQAATPPVDVLIVLGGAATSRVPADLGFGTPVVAAGQLPQGAAAQEAGRQGELLAAAACDALTRSDRQPGWSGSAAPLTVGV